MANVRMPVFLRPLAIPIIDDLLADSQQRPAEAVALELLVGFVGERDNPVEVVRGRYREITSEEKDPIVVPQHDALMRHIVRPLLEARQCYILRMPVACIAQAGLVGEMVALWRFRMLQPTVDGRALSEGLQRLILAARRPDPEGWPVDVSNSPSAGRGTLEPERARQLRQPTSVAPYRQIRLLNTGG